MLTLNPNQSKPRVRSRMQRTAPVKIPIAARAQNASRSRPRHFRVDVSFVRRDDALSCCANGLVLEPVCRSQPQRMEVVALDLFDVFDQRVEIIRDPEMATREAIGPSVSQLDDQAYRPFGIGAMP